MDKKVRVNNPANKTKCRLRKTLCERKSMQKLQRPPTSQTSAPSVQSEAGLAEAGPPKAAKLDNIDNVVKFIEGDENKVQDSKEKKQAKKARQREKREQERIKEEREKAELERMKEAMRLKTEQLAAELKEKLKLSNNSNSKSKKNQGKLVEESIQAVFNIKRYDNTSYSNGAQSVSLTLKKSSKVQEDFILSLVKGKSKTEKKVQPAQPQGKKTKTKKNAQPKQSESIDRVIELDLGKNKPQSVISVVNKEPNCCYVTNSNPETKTNKKNKQLMTDPFKTITSELLRQKKNNEPVDFSMLRLPPGITITKVKGPVVERTFRPVDHPEVHNNNDRCPGVTANASTSIIKTDIRSNSINKESIQHLIDSTCRPRIEESAPAAGPAPTPAPEQETSRRSRKKKNKKKDAPGSSSTDCNGSLVTLKNPLFKPPVQVSNPEQEKQLPDMGHYPAAIFKNENGMVTIRSSRLHQSMNGGAPIPNLLTDLKPVMGPDISTPPTSNHFGENGRLSPFDAQEVLSGLPAIEITKVDKCGTKMGELKKACQTAEVSIIRANGGGERSEKEDWHYDMVFTPKEVLEDDMDAEERELESFKRFCQESVPPKCKEKAAHLNVKDIVLRKKSDENSL